MSGSLPLVSKLHPVKDTDGTHWGYSFWCPGCKEAHSIPTAPHPKGWAFGGDEVRPTFTPSIHVHEVKREDGSTFSPTCHSFVTDGRIQYLPDCEHAMAGQTVEIPNWKGHDVESYA